MTPGWRRLCVWGCCVVAACSAGERSAAPVPTRADAAAAAASGLAVPSVSTSAAPSGVVPAAAMPSKPAARRPALVRGLQLAAKDAQRSEAVGPDVAELGRRIWNAGEEELALDIGANVRIVLAPKTELWAFELPDSLVLVSGTIWVQRSPAAQRAGETPVRFATLVGSLEITGPAEFWLRSESRSTATGAPELHTRTQLALSRGAVAWFWRGDDQALRRDTLSTDATESRESPAQGPLQLLRGSATSQRAGAFRSARELVVRGESLIEHNDRALEAALDTWAAEHAGGVALLAQSSPHYARIVPPDTRTAPLRPSSEQSAVRAYQLALASHAQRTLQARQLVRLATEQSFAGAVVGCLHSASAAQGCETLERWAEHFRLRLREAL